MSLAQSRNRESREKTTQSIADIHHRGGWFVLLDGKHPARTAYQRWTLQRPPLDACINHGGDALGLIPFSVRCSVLDIDVGNPEAIQTRYPALTAYPTPSGGRHLWYPDTEPRPNGSWAAHGAKGDVRSGAGYVALWGDGLELLAGALDNPPVQPALFPLELIGTLDQAIEAPQAIPVPEPLPNLDRVKERQRNQALFDHLRTWAYRQPRGKSYRAWLAKVEARAFALYRQIPARKEWHQFSPAEVKATARSVAYFVFFKRRYDHSPEAQRHRGKRSGKARREAVADRDSVILELRAKGWSYRAIAREMGVSKSQVMRVVMRSVPRTGHMFLC